MLSSSAERRKTVQDCQGQTKEGNCCYLNRFVPHFVLYFSTCICQPFYHVRTVQGQSVLEAQNSTVETFGWWQTEEYVPPPVVDVST